ncbi:hypothetical protein [Streptomyces sp. NPDC001536]|uniref:hypothetical protein n=1 Tax=Streptomyces sp. NPDC001536 TaxID=3364583 RepID=UPI0036A02373
MSEPAPSTKRLVLLAVGFALLLIGTLLSACATFGGSDGTADPEPTRPPATSQPSTTEPTTPEPTSSAPDPSPTPGDCYRILADVGVDETGLPTPEESTAPEPSEPTAEPTSVPTDPQPTSTAC